MGDLNDIIWSDKCRYPDSECSESCDKWGECESVKKRTVKNNWPLTIYVCAIVGAIVGYILSEITR